MDILLDTAGDLALDENGDIRLEDSVAQKIRIRLQWFSAEWRWNEELGLPYFGELLVKNPDILYFEGLLREEIFNVDEVVEVREVTISYDSRTREASIRYVALTDLETIRGELVICRNTE